MRSQAPLQMRFLARTAAAALCWMGLAIPAPAQQVRDLGLGVAHGVNDLEDAVGAYGAEPLFWESRGATIPIGSLNPIGVGVARAINRSRQAVGSSLAGPLGPGCCNAHAFLWSPNDGLVDLTPDRFSISAAYDINDAGQIVGDQAFASPFGGFPTTAFLWTTTGAAENLGTLDGGMRSSAEGVNSLGQVAGWSETGFGTTRAFLWRRPGGMLDLGTLGGLNSWASRINDMGQVVGRSEVAPGDPSTHAFIWSERDGMVDLGTLGGASSGAVDINNAGQVVGWSLTSTGETHAFLWSAGLMNDITASAGIDIANAINNDGWVAGGIQDAPGPAFDPHAVLWCAGDAPSIGNASVSPKVLWPPNHAMVTVKVNYSVASSCGTSVTTALLVTSDEPHGGIGDGHFLNDIEVVDAYTVRLRAERSALGDGRTYTITIDATDSEGRESTVSLTVTVPRSQGRR